MNRSQPRKTVFIARDPRQAAAFARVIKGTGARALSIGVIQIAPPSSWRGLDGALARFGDYDAAAFASANAVEAFFARAKKLSLKRLKAPRLVLAVGPATAQALASRGWRVDVVAKDPGGANLARAAGDVRGLRVLAPRAQDGRHDLVNGLRANGARVQAAAAYRTLPDRSGAPRIKKLIRGGVLFAAAFFSGSAARSFKSQIGRAAWERVRRDLIFGSIGPATSEALREMGAQRIIQAPRAEPLALARRLAQESRRADKRRA